MLILTLGGLVIAAAILVADKFLDLANKSTKRNVLLGLNVLALALAGYSAYLQNEDGIAAGKVAQRRHDAVVAQLASAERELVALRGVSAVTNALVGDLTKLNALGGDGKYYVRIAADTRPGGLDPYLRRIEGQFGGARASGLVAIRPPKSGSSMYALVFGQGLTLASAEVFQRLAMSHHFPPPNQVAAIEKDE
jgi:hypothetical protein